MKSVRKLVLKMSISIDGYVGGPNGELDWLFRSMDDDAAAWTVDAVWQAGVHIMGSKTFADMAAHWPSSTEVFAAPMNRIPKVVFSRSGARRTPPTNAGEIESWKNARVASGDLAAEIAKLKAEPGKNIIAHGGATFARSLVKLGLVDEYKLLVHPVALGRGLPLFSELAAPMDLELVEAKAFQGGAVAHVVRRRRP